MNPWHLILYVMGWGLLAMMVLTLLFVTVSFLHGFTSSFLLRRRMTKAARLRTPTTARELLRHDLLAILADGELSFDEVCSEIGRRIGNGLPSSPRHADWRNGAEGGPS